MFAPVARRARHLDRGQVPRCPRQVHAGARAAAKGTHPPEHSGRRLARRPWRARAWSRSPGARVRQVRPARSRPRRPSRAGSARPPFPGPVVPDGHQRDGHEHQHHPALTGRPARDRDRATAAAVHRDRPPDSGEDITALVAPAGAGGPPGGQLARACRARPAVPARLRRLLLLPGSRPSAAWAACSRRPLPAASCWACSVAPAPPPPARRRTRAARSCRPAGRRPAGPLRPSRARSDPVRFGVQACLCGFASRVISASTRTRRAWPAPPSAASGAPCPPRRGDRRRTGTSSAARTERARRRRGGTARAARSGSGGAPGSGRRCGAAARELATAAAVTGLRSGPPAARHSGPPGWLRQMIHRVASWLGVQGRGAPARHGRRAGPPHASLPARTPAGDSTRASNRPGSEHQPSAGRS